MCCLENLSGTYNTLNYGSTHMAKPFEICVLHSYQLLLYLPYFKILIQVVSDDFFRSNKSFEACYITCIYYEFIYLIRR